MSTLVFAAVWLLVGLGLVGVLRRRVEALPARVRTVVVPAILTISVAVPALVLTFSVVRVIPAGHVGVKVLFGQVDRVSLREGLNVAASLTPPLLQQPYLTRWDGRLPQYSLGGSVVPFLPMPPPGAEPPRR